MNQQVVDQRVIATISTRSPGAAACHYGLQDGKIFDFH